MLVAVLPVYSAASKINTKINNIFTISANKINFKNINHSKSTTYILKDSTKHLIKSASDTLSADSNYLPRTTSAIKSKVKYSAKDSIVYSTKSKSATLYNEAKIVYGDLDMKSAQIIIDLAKNTINAKGELDTLGKKINTPIFKQGDAEYKIEEVTFNYETKRGYMKEFKTKEGEGYIRGERVKRDEFNNFYLRDSYYTTCDAEEPHFYIEAKKLKVIPGKRVITGPANMVIEGVRTPLFVPFGVFPLKRGQQSGIIVPVYGFAGGRGYFLRQGGYYLGLGDHADVAILGDIYANSSWQLGSRINYAYRYRFAGSLSANFALNQDGLPEDKNFRKSNTFQITWGHSLDPRSKPGTTFRADVNLVGNQYLAQNTYANNNNAFSNNINSSISYGKSMGKGRYNLSANARASQNTQTRDLSITLPDLTFTVGSFQPFKPKWKPTAGSWLEKISINYTGQFQNLINTKDTLLFRHRTSEETKAYQDSTIRNGVRHVTSAQNSFNLFKYYTISLGADYNENWTFKTIRKEWDTMQRKVIETNINEFGRVYQYSFRANITTRYYGLVNFKRSRLKAVRHVLNPDAGFTYVPDFSRPTYGFYQKFQFDSTGRTSDYSIYDKSLYGGPTKGRQGNINFSVDNNIEIKWLRGKDTAQKIEKIKIFESLRASASYNIYADSLKLSTIPISFRTTLFKTVAINGGAQLDPYVNVLTETNGSKNYTRINKYYINEQNKLGLVTNANLGLSASLTPEMFKKKNNLKAEALKKEMQQNGFSEFKIPWSLSLTYTVSYDHRGRLSTKTNTEYQQNLEFNGTISPSKNWFVNFNSGYDFRQKKISHLGIDLRRDLHCWQFTFNWTPLSAFGNQYFIFNINVKSSVLQDLKYPKRKDWFDQRRI